MEVAAVEQPASSEELKLYVVQPPRGHYHDTLWDIAERHLGNGLRWKEIFQLNRHRPQPDGGRLELARLIQPGWRMLMPADAVGLPSATQDSTEDAPTNTAASAGSSAAPPHGTVTPRPTSSAADRSDDTCEVSRANQDDSASTGAADRDRDDGASVGVGALVLGLGAVAAGGLVAELKRRRRRQQRHRQPGQRLPRPEGPSAYTEQGLRARDIKVTVATVRDALRQLAAECRRLSRPLPDLQVLRVSETSVELVLGADETDAVPPFASHGPRTWRLADTPVESDEEGCDPHPALLTVGVADDAIVMVNLEAAGTLQVVGSADETAPVLRALVAELGTSPLTATLTGGLVDRSTELAQIVDQSRLRRLDSLGQAESWATSRLETVSAALFDAGLANVVEARARDLAGDVWVPEVLVLGADDIDAQTVAAPPYSGLCTVSRATTHHQDCGWALTPTGSGRWRLVPAGLEVIPQRLDDARLAHLWDLFDAAARPPIEAGGSEDSEVGGPDTVDLQKIAAALPAVPEPAVEQRREAPRVLLLGPVEVRGVGEFSEPGRLRRAMELVAYLVLHPGATQHELDEALWPGSRVSRNTRNPLVSRTRQWLGRPPTGEQYLLPVGADGKYRLRPEVTCDWHDFVRLARQGLARGPQGVDDLVRALELVRGRPFLGIDPATYTWAEADIQDMISTIVDVVHALATLALSSGDHRRARWAAAKGLLVEPVSELLYRDALRAAAAAGDADDTERLADGLRRQIELTDPDDGLSDETVKLLVAAIGHQPDPRGSSQNGHVPASQASFAPTGRSANQPRG